MRTRLTLRPGQRGTRRLLAEHGDRLVCVRYRYDESTKSRYKTVELVIDKTPWDPDLQLRGKIVPVKVTREELDLRERVKSAGGRWDRERRVWELQYERAADLGLSDRIVREGT